MTILSMSPHLNHWHPIPLFHTSKNRDATSGWQAMYDSYERCKTKSCLFAGIQSLSALRVHGGGDGSTAGPGCLAAPARR